MSTTTKVTCKIKELSNYQFMGLTLRESIGDDLPTGELTFLQEDEDQDLSIENLTIDLVLDSEYQLSLKGFVDEVDNRKGENVWRITFTPKEFYQDPRMNEFSGIKNLISSLNPYELLSSLDSDAGLEGVKLYQNNVSNYQCLIKYLKALKSKTVYAFRLDGLYLSDLTKSPTESLHIQSIERNLSLQVRRNKFLSLKATSGELTTNGIVNVHYNNETHAVAKEFVDAYKNYLENFRISQSLEDKFEYSFPDYMNLRVGDLVKLKGVNFENNNYVVTDNLLDLSPGKIINTLKFSAI